MTAAAPVHTETVLEDEVCEHLEPHRRLCDGPGYAPQPGRRGSRPVDGVESAFYTGSFQALIVASKFQTGVDHPRLVAMYADQQLDGVLAVQTLSRLKQTIVGKETSFVLGLLKHL